MNQVKNIVSYIIFNDIAIITFEHIIIMTHATHFGVKKNVSPLHGVWMTKKKIKYTFSILLFVIKTGLS